METIILLSQIVFGVMLTISILFQGRGTGLGTAWGGGETYRSKRGMEKILFWSTIVLATCFLLNSVASILAR